MRTLRIIAIMAVMAAASGAVLAGETVQGESNWEKFKEGAKQAGSAAWSGTKNAAEKTGDAVTRGARKTGEFFAEGYQDAKEYVHEKTASNDDQPIIIEGQPLPPAEPQPAPQTAPGY